MLALSFYLAAAGKSGQDWRLELGVIENTWIEFEVSLGYRVKELGGVQDLEQEPGARRGTVKKTEEVWSVFGSQSSENKPSRYGQRVYKLFMHCLSCA